MSAGAEPAGDRIGLTGTKSVPSLLDALALPRLGEIYDLSVTLSPHMPQGSPEVFSRFTVNHYHLPRALISRERGLPFDYAMDVISGSPHLGTHIDGLAHIACHGEFFGGVSVEAAYSDFGWRLNGIENAPLIIARGIMADVAGYHNADSIPDRYEISAEELQQVIARQGTTVMAGDVVLVRTGKIGEFKQGRESYFGAQPGVGSQAARWLASMGMAALGTDTSGTEPHPLVDPADTAHRALLVELGIHIIEIMDLDTLAEQQIYEFLFICLPLKIAGATGSWVRPVAIR